jgi:hypothetical protein
MPSNPIHVWRRKRQSVAVLFSQVRNCEARQDAHAAQLIRDLAVSELDELLRRKHELVLAGVDARAF